MQKNPGAKTIEGELEEALYHAGGVPEHDRGKPKRFDWARAARTDKGVSAVGQVVSGRFYIDPPGFVERLNSFIPNQIRIFGFKRVTNSFSAKKFCDRRRYIYLIPVFALDNKYHRDRESVLASLGSENELVKCVECSERGRSRHKVDENVNNVENVREERNETAENGGGFRYGEKEKARFNSILKRYVGTHNFHNFTTRIKAEDPSAIRYIISFNANNVVTVDGIDFVKCEVVGQSFMLHQIRKLVGLAVAIMRDCAPEALIDVALKKDVNINVPTAPEVGLYLDECLFTSYNQKWRDSHEEITMEPYADQAEDFKMKQVYSHIASTEQKEGSVGIWLHSLNHRNYPDLRYLESSVGSNKGENAPLDEINCGAGANGENALLDNINCGAVSNGESAPLDDINCGGGANGESTLLENINRGPNSNGENAQLNDINRGAGANGESVLHNNINCGAGGSTESTTLSNINSGAGTKGANVQEDIMEVEVEVNGS